MHTGTPEFPLLFLRTIISSVIYILYDCLFYVINQLKIITITKIPHQYRHMNRDSENKALP